MNGNEHIPCVTVLMPVYNGERYLREAIDSILAQTFADFELFIINDGSTDGSVAIVESFDDPRIRLVHNDRNLGLIATLNRGIDLARGEYIARMDCDDVSLPERFEKQIAFMRRHPDVGICGTWVATIDGPSRDVWRYPVDHDAIVFSLLFASVIAHPTVMMRRDFLLKYGVRYSSEYRHAEDFELWTRTARLTRLANLGEVLLLYRLHPSQVTKHHDEERSASAGKVRMKQLADLGITPSSEEFALHQAIGEWRFESDRDFVEKEEKWLIRLLKANDAAHRYDGQAFAAALAGSWFEVCDAATELGSWTFRKYLSSPFGLKANVPWRRRIGFFANCMMGRSR